MKCQIICENIRKIEHVVDVYPAFREIDESSIIFIVTPKIESDDILKSLSGLRIDYIVKKLDFNNSGISSSKSFVEIQMKGGEIEMIRTCIMNNEQKLMGKHKYLSILEGFCHILKEEASSAGSAYKYEPRLALYVLAKGYIPIDEDPFEQSYDGIRVDVREGVFIPFVNTANTKHPNVRIGCQIQRAQHKCGTLGLFIEHHSYGICGLTCAHVMLSEEERERCKLNNGHLYTNIKDDEVYQPQRPDTLGRFVEAIYQKGSLTKVGIDIALVQIDERYPVNGNFPSTDENVADLEYASGRVLGPSIRNARCCKYGSSTGYTEGQLFDFGPPSRVRDVLNWLRYTFTIYNQIKVQPLKPFTQIFAEPGDSGAPVFVKDGDGQLACIGIIIGGGPNGVVYVTPITRILQELGITQLKSFAPNVAEMARDIQTLKTNVSTEFSNMNNKIDTLISIVNSRIQNI